GGSPSSKPSPMPMKKPPPQPATSSAAPSAAQAARASEATQTRRATTRRDMQPSYGHRAHDAPPHGRLDGDAPHRLFRPSGCCRTDAMNDRRPEGFDAAARRRAGVALAVLLVAAAVGVVVWSNRDATQLAEA